MKTIKSITTLIAIVASFAITSCSEKDNPEPTPTPDPIKAALATVSTTDITILSKTTATGGGNVTADGGAAVTEKGICIGTSPAPTIDNSVIKSGTGNGDFTASLTALALNTTYYVRAYAINSAGTAYGSEVTFTTPDVDIYLSGGVENDAGYWKNGKYVALTTDNTGSYATAIYISGEDVYVAGYNGNSLVYWKNGVATKLEEAGSAQLNAGDMVVSGNDVYVGGSKIQNNFATPRLWKNGVEMSIQTGGGSAMIVAVAVSGTDVYAAGSEAINGVDVATYWKNGVGVHVSDGITDAEVQTMFVKDNDVYLGGFQRGSDVLIAKYWKNSDEITLSSGSNNYVVNDMFVTDTDVYNVGQSYDASFNQGDAIIWKDKTQGTVTTSSGTSVGEGDKIWVSASDVYVFGTYSDSEGFGWYVWKNGVKLAPYEDGTLASDGSISDMFVIDK